jgi:hypothetical protein
MTKVIRYKLDTQAVMRSADYEGFRRESIHILREI